MSLQIKTFVLEMLKTLYIFNISVLEGVGCKVTKIYASLYFDNIVKKAKQKKW